MAKLNLEKLLAMEDGIYTPPSVGITVKQRGIYTPQYITSDGDISGEID